MFSLSCLGLRCSLNMLLKRGQIKTDTQKEQCKKLTRNTHTLSRWLAGYPGGGAAVCCPWTQVQVEITL